MASTASLPHSVPPVVDTPEGPRTSSPNPAAPSTSLPSGSSLPGEAAAEALHQRMDQFLLNIRQQQQRRAAEDEEYANHAQEGATSGSNSGEEDDREIGENGKRLGGIINGLSSKKRRKQSKPMRMGANEGQEGGELPAAPEGEAEEGERRYSTEDELEEGERRPDGPLNLSSDKDGDDKPPLRILGAELLQNPRALLAQGGEEGELSKEKLAQIPTSFYQGMLPFGMPPFPFPFPNTSSAGGKPGGFPGPMPGSPLNAQGRPQIFNPEAYCELCNKEFCNKYFLKTHKANKHGIYTDNPPTSSAPGSGSRGSPAPMPLPPSSMASNGTPPYPQQKSDSGVEGSGSQPGPPTPNSQGGSPFSGAFIAANMGSLRPPFMPLSPGASPSPTSSQQQHNQRREEGLRENGTNGHKTPNREDQSPRPPSLHMRPDLMSPKGMPEDAVRALEDRMRKEGGGPPIPGLPPQFGNFNPLMFGGIPSLDSLRKEEEMRSKEAGKMLQGLPNLPGLPGLPGAPPTSQGGSPSNPKGQFSTDKLRQMGVINADAFCEICCKEFCNKYFLRVHKLKKHGICSPDLPPEKVQKILNQMAKEAGKTGNPPPPLIRPPMMPGNGHGPPTSVDSLLQGNMPFGPMGLPGLRPPNPPSSGASGLIPLPPLEPLLPQALKDFQSPLPQTSQPNDSPLKEKNESGHASNHGEREIIRITDDSEDGEMSREQGIRASLGEQERPKSVSAASTGSQQPGEDLQRLQSMIMELNSNKAKGEEAARAAAQGANGPQTEGNSCKICNKDMENKFFLRAHMMNEHGVLHMDEGPLPPPLNFNSLNPADPAGLKATLEAAGLSAPGDKGPNPFAPFMNGSLTPESADLASKFLQQMQKGLGVNLPLDDSELSFLERVKSELAGSPKRMDRDPNRKPASLSRSYCEICKKELCNKYFMKTHMMKMHGINIEATNNQTAVCHVCKKELCSKYFLKVHLQNSHGIIEDGPPLPPPPGMKENGGGLFPGLFPPPPPPEMLNLSGGPGSPDKDRYFSRLLGEQSELSRERMREMERQKHAAEGAAGEGAATAGHKCSLCGENFPEIVALQVHIIKSHGAFPPESGALFGTPPKEMSGSSDREGTDHEGEGTSQSEPNHKTDEERAAQNKEQEEGEQRREAETPKNHMNLPPLDGDAARQFPNIEMLQRHMLSQQFPGLISPLLQGFPGFPGSGLPNPLQQFFGGPKPGDQSKPGTPGAEVNNLSSSSTSSNSNKKASGKRRTKRFKCSKCQAKFGNRENCLRHIQATHNPRRPRRKLSFSPSKKSRSANFRTQQRSQYVKQLMALLKVPTSRGTPHHGDEDEETTKHIMQPFLLKAPDSPRTDSEEANSSPRNGGANGVMNNNENSAKLDEIHVNFVPSLVYLPVAKRVSQPMTVAFNLTPA